MHCGLVDAARPGQLDSILFMTNYLPCRYSFISQQNVTEPLKLFHLDSCLLFISIFMCDELRVTQLVRQVKSNKCVLFLSLIIHLVRHRIPSFLTQLISSVH